MTEFGELQDENDIETVSLVDQLRENLKNPDFLPTYVEIKQAFSNDEESDSFFYNKESPVFELLNEEYLNLLANYFVESVEAYGENKDNPFVILEVGAGDGRLSHFLRNKLEEKIPGKTKVIATDSGEWDIKKHFPVEALGHVKAMEKYNPDVVVCSWMPLGEDFSKDIRKCDRVKEYILIGDSSCCGDEWETWGRDWTGDKSKEEITLYEKDGFEKVELLDFRRLQFCRTDSISYALLNHSETVSFRRK